MPKAKRSDSPRAAVDRTGVTAWIDRRLWRALKHYAVEHDTTVSRLVTDLIDKHLAPLVNGTRRPQ